MGLKEVYESNSFQYLRQGDTPLWPNVLRKTLVAQIMNFDEMKFNNRRLSL